MVVNNVKHFGKISYFLIYLIVAPPLFKTTYKIQHVTLSLSKSTFVAKFYI